MDFTKANILLDKINHLFHSMKMDAQHISSIEMDLMKSYVRQFYEELHPPSLNHAVNLPPAPVQEVKIETPPAPTPAPPFAQVFQEKPKPAPDFPTSVPVEQPPLSSAPPAEEDPETPDYDNLFGQENSKSKELIDHLGESPIDDLKNAFSINDKIWYINELFNKNNEAFEDAIWKLNNLRNFEEAKKFILGELVRQYNWEDKNKLRAAKKFNKIIKRRYKTH